MIDGAKRLIRKYPQLALGCCGMCLIIGSFTVLVNLKLIMIYSPSRLGHWVNVTVQIGHIIAIVVGAILIGSGILWELHRRRLENGL